MSDTNTSIKTVIDQVALYKNNPAGIKRVVYDHLRNILDEKVDIVDPTTPFTSLMESACVLTSAFMVEHEAGLRKQYASLAQTEDDLYYHMSDKDYIDRFASPAMTRFNLLIDLEELKEKLVLDPNTGIKKVVIPRNSEFVINDVVFSLQYPIEIKQLTHGGFQVVYDTTVTSPLQSLTTNVVDWSIRTVSVNQQQMMHLEFDVYQFSIVSYKGDLISSSGYKKKLSYKDQYYYCRVYYKNSQTNNEWTEMYTTHTDQVYDNNKPTAVLKVYYNSVEVMIPQVYFTSNLVSGGIRVDIFQTKGPVNMILENFKPSSFTANFILIDKDEVTEEISAFRSIQSVFPYASKTVSGGKDAIEFATLRERVIKNSIGAKDLPITNVQIETSLENSGFDIVKNVDVITNRQFLATKLLPKPFDEKLITAASASIETLIGSMDQIRVHSKVKDNGNRITIVPEMIFENNNGIISIVSANDEQALSSLDPDVLAKTVNERNFLYTPFHYVLDTTSSSFSVRPYYLDNPTAVSCQFVSQNDTTQLQVNTGTYKLVKTTEGFKLYVEVVSNQNYKDLDDSLVHVQLSFVPHGESNQAYLNGRLIGLTDEGERLFEFDIGSRFDIDKDDLIVLNSFNILSAGTYDLSSALDNTFQLYYSTSALMDASWVSRSEDSELGLYLLPSRIAFITKENIELKFGYALKNLWASARSIPAVSAYQTYDHNMPAVYDDDVYAIDTTTGSIFSFDASGNIVYNLLHAKGDPILDAQGMPVYKYRIGDTIRDSDNNPVPVSENSVVRQFDIMFIEGCYYFATDVASVVYKDSIVSTIVDWIIVDLYTLSQQLLEQTELFYYPKMTMGSIRIMNDKGVVSSIEANQSFIVNLYVSETTYENEDLRNELKISTINTIDNHLKGSTISVSTLTSLLKDVYSTDVIAFNVSGFGPNQDIQMLTVLNEGERFAIKKKLSAQADGKLIVTEAVEVNFTQHGS